MYYSLKLVYCTIFDDSFGELIDSLWNEKYQKNEKDMVQKSIIFHNSTFFLNKVKWQNIPRDSRVRWLNRFKFNVLLSVLLNNEKLLTFFCEKKMLNLEKTIISFHKMENWINLCVGCQSSLNYSRISRNEFENYIINPAWDFYDILSRNNKKECKEIKKVLIDAEKWIKQ